MREAAASLHAVGFGLAGIAKNKIERYVDSAKSRFPGGLVHFVEMLMPLVHEFQDIGGR